MFKIISTKALKRQQLAREQAEKTLDRRNKSLAEMEVAVEALDREILELRQRAEKAEELLNHDGNQVVIQIWDDLQSITPLVKWQPGVADKMLETGRIDDTSDRSDFSIQLVLLQIAHEGVEQIIEQFSVPFDDGE